MAHKELKYAEEARGALQAGVDAVANAVKVTLGPKGRYVVLDKKFGAPTITNDGVTIAREVEVEDVFENQGAQLVREVATATNDVAGDGTTTATLLDVDLFITDNWPMENNRPDTDSSPSFFLNAVYSGCSTRPHF